MRQLYYSILMLLRGRSNNLTKTISLTLGLFIGILLFACVAFQLSYNHFSTNRATLSGLHDKCVEWCTGRRRPLYLWNFR